VVEAFFLHDTNDACENIEYSGVISSVGIIFIISSNLLCLQRQCRPLQERIEVLDLLQDTS